MSSDLWEAGRPSTPSDHDWTPSERTRFWLPLGIAALLIDVCLGVAQAALEQAHWGKDGLTPDVLVGYAALLPQTLIVATYLVLARDAGARSLYKSMAGLFASYLLLSLLSLVTLEVLRGGGSAAIMVAAGVGIIGLIVYTFSSWPRFETTADNAGQAGAELPKEASGNPGCWIHAVIFLGLLFGRRLLRNANNLFPNVNFGIGDWAVLEMAVLVIIGLAYAVWFAAAKVKHRAQLGWPAAALGTLEILILLAHLAMFAAFIALILSAAAANPQPDEDDLDKLMDDWLRRGVIASAACHALWALGTSAFFASMWLRPARDWREEYFAPSIPQR